MIICPECKGRATKIIHLSENKVECQKCGAKWPWAKEGEQKKEA